MRRAIWLLLLPILIVIPALSLCDVSKVFSNFDDGSLQGWVLQNQTDGYISNPGVGGNPGGYLVVTDTLQGGGGIVIVAPQEFLGDLSVYDGLSWNEYIFPETAARVTKPRITGADGTVYCQKEVPDPYPGHWCARYVSFHDEAQWTLEQGVATFGSVIVDVVALRFETDVHSQTGEEAGLDNICLAAEGTTEIGLPNRTGSCYLGPCVPNPFNPRTTIKFSIPMSGYAKLAIYDVKGRQIAVLKEECLAKGFYTVDWDGRDDNGNTMAAGAYLFRLESKEKSVTTKGVLVK